MNSVYCRQCKTSIAPNVAYCSACGAPQFPSAAQITPTVVIPPTIPQVRQKRRLWPIVGVLAVGVVIGVLAASKPSIVKVADKQSVSTLTVEDLLNDPVKYDGKTVRVRCVVDGVIHDAIILGDSYAGFRSSLMGGGDYIRNNCIVGQPNTFSLQNGDPCIAEGVFTVDGILQLSKLQKITP